MRNTLIYPITDEEIIQTLQRVLDQESAKQLVGGTQMLCLQRAIERIRKYPEETRP